MYFYNYVCIYIYTYKKMYHGTLTMYHGTLTMSHDILTMYHGTFSYGYIYVSV